MTVDKLTPITEENLLKEVKTAIKMEGNDYNDGTITVWINSIKQDLLYAGVSQAVADSTCAVGCIAQGVDDIWVSHRGAYSDLFYQGVERLRNTTLKEG